METDNNEADERERERRSWGGVLEAVGKGLESRREGNSGSAARDRLSRRRIAESFRHRSRRFEWLEAGAECLRGMVWAGATSQSR
jgi:hypothetical protein